MTYQEHLRVARHHLTEAHKAYQQTLRQTKRVHRTFDNAMAWMLKLFARVPVS